MIRPAWRTLLAATRAPRLRGVKACYDISLLRRTVPQSHVHKVCKIHNAHKVHQGYPVCGFHSSPCNLQKYFTESELQEHREVRQWLETFTPQSIPVGEFDVRYSRSRGPGGQNVNKLNTKVDVRWVVAGSDWLPSYVKRKLREHHGQKFNSKGEFVVASDAHRTQQQNQKECFKKVFEMIVASASVPNETSEEQQKKVKGLMRAFNEKRLQSKKMRSQRKDKSWKREV